MQRKSRGLLNFFGRGDPAFIFLRLPGVGVFFFFFPTGYKNILLYYAAAIEAVKVLLLVISLVRNAINTHFTLMRRLLTRWLISRLRFNFPFSIFSLVVVAALM